jgi:hypothetical protein
MSSAPARKIIVTREHQPTPGNCISAVALLLKKPVNEGGPAKTAPDEAERSSSDGPAEKYTSSP